MSICHKPTLSFTLNMICSESLSKNNAKWPIKSGAVDPQLPVCVVSMCSKYSLCFTFRFQALDESFHMASHLYPHCGSSYQSISGLRKNVDAKHSCDQGSAEEHQLKLHLIKHGGDQVKCSVCDKNFRRHMTGAHENVKHRYRTCKTVFMEKDEL